MFSIQSKALEYSDLNTFSILEKTFVLCRLIGITKGVMKWHVVGYTEKCTQRSLRDGTGGSIGK